MGSFKEEWTEAMEWWQGLGEMPNMFYGGMFDVTAKVREIASRRLQLRLAGTGEGIGTSDVNHEVFSIYREYKASEAPSVLSFLVSINAELEGI